MKQLTVVVASLALVSGIAVAGDDMKTKTFTELDQNQDGLIDRADAGKDANLSMNFASVDVNQDGYISPAEFDEFIGVQDRDIEEAE